eukprot:TRINITY_DN12722_c1_g1_i1.p1 TRINITY_DN12722_c1_g1~~TRINITY_DN12722_c1_g1_i1.p1  ORF type:complete len:216 (-),score=28.01 TRINITY_DN12722_c1_g1_i1:326-973(-)
MVKVSVCMACRKWSKGWQDRTNPPYNQHYCTDCWAKYMGYQNISTKQTVWLRETWKSDNSAVSHSASCARAERHEARKAQGKEIRVPASPWHAAWSSADPDADVSNDGWSSDDEGRGASEAARSDREAGRERERERERETSEEEHETPPWVQRAIDVLWEHGGGNMKYTTFQKLAGRKMTGVSKKDVFARREFEWCGKSNNSIRLAGWLRLQRYS